MLLQRLFLAGLVLLVLAFGWRFWRAAQATDGPAAPTRPAATAIDFDNGSVRAPPVVKPRPPGTVPGQMTKCVRGSETVYTHFTCPPGHRAVPMTGGTVNVVAGSARGTGQPAGRAASGGLPPGGAKASLHDALDLDHDARLRERLIERAVNDSR